MNYNPVDIYKELRLDHVARFMGTGKVSHYKVTAVQAWKTAKYTAETLSKWEEAEDNNLVKFEVVPDEMGYSLDDLAGDCFNPKANPDINPQTLKKQEKEFIERVNREGVNGIVGKYWNGEEWEVADSVWGFVGDDWENSGYDIDVKASTLDELAKVEICPCCGRPKKG